MNSFSRLVTALVLASSLLAGSVASFAQTSDPAKAQKPNETAPSTTATKRIRASPSQLKPQVPTSRFP